MNPSIPATMHAIQLDQPNGELTWRETPVPRPQAGQVLIRMAAAPINPSDLSMLEGDAQYTGRAYPFTPGIEGSGIVVAAGPGLMPKLLRGRRVACSAPPSGAGTWAEYLLTSASLCVPLTRAVSLEQGAMLLVNPLTALAMMEIAQQGKHRAIVNTAAASVLGGMLLHLAERHDLPVIHIVRRPAQVDLVRSRGGKLILNSSAANFVEQLRAVAYEAQATLWLDAIGGEMTQQLAHAALFGSTLLMYGRMSHQDALIDPRLLVQKDLRIQGWYLPNWIRTKNLLQVLQLSWRAQSLVATDLQSKIQKYIPLSAAQQGLETYTQNMTAGKILLVADGQEVGIE